MNKKVLPEVEPVVLDKICGIRAGLFILIAAIVGLLILFFLVFMLPGILNGGSYVSFHSNLHDVGVVLDGRYLGTAEDGRYYIEAGIHDVEYIHSGKTLKSESLDVDKHIFFTLIRHPGMDVDVNLDNTTELEETVRANFIRDIALWTKSSAYSEFYSYPPLVTNFAEDAVNMKFSDVYDEMLYALMHVSSGEAAADFENGYEILKKAGFRLPEYDIDLDGLFTEEGVGKVTAAENPMTDSAYYREFHFYDGGLITLGRSGNIAYPETNTYPVEVFVEPFALAHHPVTEYEYALFLDDNPEWNIENREKLIEKGLVDEFYLEGVFTSTSFISNKPVRNISWYAAKAYTEWASEITGEEFYLPSEAEWTFAALSAKDAPYATTLTYRSADHDHPSAMLGGLWEMTDTAYMPLSRLFGYEEASTLSTSFDDIIVKGGSYMNSGIDEMTVGVQERSTCSEYTGFRVAKKI